MESGCRFHFKMRVSVNKRETEEMPDILAWCWEARWLIWNLMMYGNTHTRNTHLERHSMQTDPACKQWPWYPVLFPFWTRFTAQEWKKQKKTQTKKYFIINFLLLNQILSITVFSSWDSESYFLILTMITQPPAVWFPYVLMIKHLN